MSTALTTSPAALPERFANPLQQIRGVLGQPAVRRSLPMILMIGLIGAAVARQRELELPVGEDLRRTVVTSEPGTEG